jgi:hypothetical protein
MSLSSSTLGSTVTTNWAARAEYSIVRVQGTDSGNPTVPKIRNPVWLELNLSRAVRPLEAVFGCEQDVPYPQKVCAASSTVDLHLTVTTVATTSCQVGQAIRIAMSTAGKLLFQC